MAQKPYKSAILNGIYDAWNRQPVTKAARVRPAQIQRYTPGSIQRAKANRGLYVSDELQQAQKALPYSQYVDDFINDTGLYSDIYDERQLAMAYSTSVYLFAAMRRLGFLMSEIRIVGERKHGGRWERLPETHHMNVMFDQAGAAFLFDMCMFFALYGEVLIYKRKSRKAVYAAHREKPITGYLKGAVSGLHILPNAYWTKFDDEYSGEIHSFNLNMQDEIVGRRSQLDRSEVIFLHDWHPFLINGSVSMASLAINNAITNAAIARWAAHYFMSGAMPLLLVSPENSIDEDMTEVDTRRYKNLVERIWQGMWGKYSLRSVFTERKLNVQEAGIKADEVMAPDLDRSALNNIASTFQFAPDLIVPPEGGSDNARHKHLQMAAYTDAVLPIARRMLTGINRDLELDGSDYRLVIAEDEIAALEAGRADEAATEISVFQAGVQTYGETQERLRSDPIKPLEKFLYVDGKLKSVERVLREDKMASADILQYAATGWNDGALRLAEYRKLMYDLDTPQPIAGKFKHEFVPEPGGGDFGDAPAGPPAPEPAPGGPGGGGASPAPEAKEPKPAPKPEADASPKPESDGDKAEQIRQTDEIDAPQPQDGSHRDDLLIQDATIEAGVHEGSEHPMPIDSEGPVSDRLLKQGTQVTMLEPDVGDPTPYTPGGPRPMSQLPSDADTGFAGDAPAFAGPVYASLNVANDPLIHMVRQQLAALIGEDYDVKWNDPETWHVTLAYSPEAGVESVEAMCKLLPDALHQFAIRATGFHHFETPEGLAIVMAVELDNALDALQAKVRTAMSTYQLPLSEYSQAGNYTPHVTLAHAHLESIVPEFNYAVALEPESLDISRDDFEVVAQIPITQDWREAITDYDEADDTETILAPPTPEQLASIEAQMLQRRETIRQALEAWQTGSDLLKAPDTVPEDVTRLLVEAQRWTEDTGAVFAAAFRALAAGDLDLDTENEENPVIKALEEDIAVQQTAQDELRAWQRSALRNPRKAQKRFEIRLLPLAIESHVREALKSAGDRVAVKAIFEEATGMLDEATAVADMEETDFTAWAARLQDDDELKSLLDMPEEGDDGGE